MFELTYWNRPRYPDSDGNSWPAGPWDDEPDKVQWVDRATRLDCLAVRNHMGAWCGYVGVQEGHPCFGKKFSDLDLEVHGGLTFSDFCMEDDRPQAERVCHIPPPGSSERVWWLGFDCGHAWDLVPRMLAVHRRIQADMPAPLREVGPIDVYRPLDYVRSECRGLALQLSAIGDLWEAKKALGAGE